jgi:hypothetical protein
MSFPPPLTWLHLLSRGAGCVCDASAPQWLRALLEAQAPAGAGEAADGARQTCANGGSAAGLLEEIGGAVAVNAPEARARFEAAGFAYVRELAVLPRLEHARWFVPLDCGACAAAGLSLYTPARRSAHFKKWVATLAARSGLRFWCGDILTVASREIPPLERKLGELFPGVEIRLALSAGAAEPARNRKASAAVIDRRGGVLGFVKIAGSDVSRAIAGHEAEILAALSRVAGRWPKLLFAGEVDGSFMTIQTPLAGKAAPAKFTAAHGRFLRSLQGERKPAAQTRLVAMLPARIAALPERADPRGLAAHLQSILRVLQTTVVPSTIVHGDFAPWNLRAHRGEIAAFDWEYAELDGVPLFDEAHFRLQVGYLLHGWSPEQALRCLDAMASANTLSLAPAQVRALQAVYFIDNLVRLLAEGYDADDEMLAWYRQTLRMLAPEAAVADPAAGVTESSGPLARKAVPA